MGSWLLCTVAFPLSHKLIKMFLQACSDFPAQLLTLRLGTFASFVSSAVIGGARRGAVVRAWPEPGFCRAWQEPGAHSAVSAGMLAALLAQRRRGRCI